MITLQVSTGPQTSQVPDVTSQTEADARAQLQQSGFEIQVVEEIVDDQSLDGPRALTGPGGWHRRRAGHVGGDRRSAASSSRRRRPPRRPRRPRPSVSRRIRVAVVAGGRSSEHEISLASARSVAGGARSGAVRDDDDRDRPRRPVGARGGQVAGCCKATVRDAAGARRLEAGGGDRLRRRRAARPARPVRRGRHRPGPAGARERAVRGSRRRGIRALHGQGPLQGRAPRPRDPGRAQRDAAPRRRDREPVRVPGLRQAGAARLLGRDLEGP